MTNLKCPYEKQFSPFKFAEENKAPWLKEYKDTITEIIASVAKQLYEEAAYCKEVNLLDSDYMYTRFKENCEHGLAFGNWIILKYFYRMMYIKVMKEMIGEWSYTAEDKEMYEYFLNLTVDTKIKCKPNMFKFQSCTEDDGRGIVRGNAVGGIIYAEFKSDDITANNVLDLHYNFYFNFKFMALENMLRNAKMLTKSITNYDFFGSDCFRTFEFDSYRGRFGNDISYSIKEVLQNWQKEAYKPKNVKPADFYAEAEIFAKANPLYNKLTAERDALYLKLLEDFTKTERGKQLLDCLPAEYKAQLGN